jgi:hypothetical protein
MSKIKLEIRRGEPIQVGQRRITPLASVLKVDFPGYQGGLVWNRPSAVLVTEADGQEHRLPVQDYTRQAQWLLIGAGVLGSLLIWLTFRSRNQQS